MNRSVEQWQLKKNAISSEGGIVACQNWLAAAVGSDVLALGGNAVDAAVASAFSLNALEPWMSGLGGSGYIVIWLAKDNRAFAIDFQLSSIHSFMNLSLGVFPLEISLYPSSIML